MPELPEVETTRRGIAPWLERRRIAGCLVRERRLRWPIPDDMETHLAGCLVERVQRRGKYLLLRTVRGTALMHLGMSGSLQVLPAAAAPGRHDHYDLVLESGKCVRFTDPRRFGSLLWTEADPAAHPLLAALGPEPLEPEFSGDYLWRRARGRKVAVKLFIMNAAIVVGVGNIYASEALYRAGIDPRRAAGRVSRAAMARLATSIRAVLGDALHLGGTTLRDFRHATGKTGGFEPQLRVYGRAGLSCPACETPILHIVQGQRSTYYCPVCQR
ncbi:MAG: bifunctional DNA-formamidopyrimidine glycosylase/DNA-(apurinic or apyrimidinic site) lyase [Gammaproteobacteria bacterium]|nr:MAG: bifunctional DNA-formamidopyrimidine glycosylase/DNA-(apurinic or apyrimidinic site) lyase [Gammaproteobacteria bacterium]